MTRRIIAFPSNGLVATSTPNQPVVSQGIGALTQFAPSPDGLLMPMDKTFIIGGNIVVPSGTSNWIGGWFAHIPPGWTCAIEAVWTMLQAGGTATYALQLNGVNISGLENITATTTQPTSPSAQPTGFVDVMDGNLITPLVNGATGTPANLIIGMFLNWQQDA